MRFRFDAQLPRRLAAWLRDQRRGNGMKLARLEKLIDELHLSEHRDAILASVRPAIYIRLGEPGAGRTRASRIGGVPDLPASLPWPTGVPDGRKLSFLLQIDLAELPAVPNGPLPARGMLYLFAGGGGDGAEQLVVCTGGEPLQPRQLADGEPLATDWYEDLVPHRLAFELGPDIPRWATSDFDALCDAVGDADAVEDLANALAEGAVGKLLGHAAGIGHDPREDAYVVREVNPAWLYDYAKRGTLDMSRAAKWRNLLQVESSDEVGLLIGDAGYLQVLVHQDDLARQDFSRVYVNLQSS